MTQHPPGHVASRTILLFAWTQATERGRRNTAGQTPRAFGNIRIRDTTALLPAAKLEYDEWRAGDIKFDSIENTSRSSPRYPDHDALAQTPFLDMTESFPFVCWRGFCWLPFHWGVPAGLPLSSVRRYGASASLWRGRAETVNMGFKLQRMTGQSHRLAGRCLTLVQLFSYDFGSQFELSIPPGAATLPDLVHPGH